MGRILTVIWKELLLLSRDHAGLLSLFLLPAALVLVITLVQQNVMELTGERAGSMIFIDHDQGKLGPELQALLREHRGIELVTWPVERAEEARVAVVAGEYSGLLILPEGTSEDLRLRLERLAAAAADQEEADDRTVVSQQESVVLPPELQLFFDPALLPGFRQEISTMVRLAMARVELEWKLELLVGTIRHRLEELGIPGEFLRQETFGVETLSEELLRLREWTEGQKQRRQPGVVQQNVPAWALFGMFFTVLPLGGGLFWERRSGVWLRFRSMPLAVASLLGGKMLAYLLVGLCQFALIYLIGNRLFPLLDLPAFSLAGLYWEVGLVVLVVSLAACGYGLMLGSACSSYEQVAMFGSISIVLAAALGGIMVPVYAMPAFMQQLAVVSPLNWGLTAFHEILVRGHGLAGAGIWLFWLLLFALGNLLLAWRLTAK